MPRKELLLYASVAMLPVLIASDLVPKWAQLLCSTLNAGLVAIKAYQDQTSAQNKDEIK